MALAVLMHSKWTMASDHAHKVATDFGASKRSSGAGPIPVPLKYRSKHAHLHASSSVSPPGGRHHSHTRHIRHPHAHARAMARIEVRDDPVRDGVRLAYDSDARLPSDRKDNMVTVGGDLSEGIRQWDCESDLRLGDIVRDGDAEVAYTVTQGRQQRRRARQRRKGGDYAGAEGAENDDAIFDDFDVMDDGWESDDDAAISLADGWAEMESWRDLAPHVPQEA